MSDKKDIDSFNDDLTELIKDYSGYATTGEVLGALTMAQHLIIYSAINEQEQSNDH